jgi:hypothetical protein
VAYRGVPISKNTTVLDDSGVELGLDNGYMNIQSVWLLGTTTQCCPMPGQTKYMYTTDNLAIEGPVVSHSDTPQAGCNDIEPEISTEDRGQGYKTDRSPKDAMSSAMLSLHNLILANHPTEP